MSIGLGSACRNEMVQADTIDANAHPHKGSHDLCYYTVGNGIRPQLMTFRGVVGQRYFEPSPGDAYLTPGGSSSRKCSTSARWNSGRRHGEHLSHFCQFGIDKPLKDGRHSQNEPRNNGDVTPKRSSAGIGLERLFNPHRGFEDSVDPDTRQQRKQFEKHLRGFFVETQGRRHALKNYNTFKSDDDRPQSTVWVIHPWSERRFRWDLFMVLVCTLSMILVPIMVAFLEYYEWWEKCLTFNIVSDSICLVDILFNFRTGFVDRRGVHHKVTLSVREIRLHYMRGWFAVDMISTFPFDYTVPKIIQAFCTTSPSL